MAVRYVVFDWDGTLADTYPVIASAYRHTFETLGMKPIAYSEIKRITSTLANKDILGHVFGEKKEQAKKAYYAYIDAHHKTYLQPIPHAKEVLDFCRQKGLHLLLLSNKKRDYLCEEMQFLGFADYFNKVVAAGDCAEDKPDPQAVRALFDDFKQGVDDILVLGDGLADWKVSQFLRKEGKKSLCVIYNPCQDFKGGTPDYLVSDMADVITILRKENNE